MTPNHFGVLKIPLIWNLIKATREFLNMEVTNWTIIHYLKKKSMSNLQQWIARCVCCLANFELSLFRKGKRKKFSEQLLQIVVAAVYNSPGFPPPLFDSSYIIPL